jgi:hypothetical protein
MQMRILERTGERLVIEIRPIALMILCYGFFLLFLFLGFGMPLYAPALLRLFGVPPSAALDGALDGALDLPGMNLLGYASVIPLAIGVFLIKTRRLTFDRRAGTITAAARGLFGRSEQTYPLAGFQGASVVRSRSSDNNSSTYTAMLHFPDQTVPVTPYATGGREPDAIAAAINAWVGTGGPGQTITLSGQDAAEALAALEKLGIRLPRQERLVDDFVTPRCR